MRQILIKIINCYNTIDDLFNGNVKYYLNVSLSFLLTNLK